MQCIFLAICTCEGWIARFPLTLPHHVIYVDGLPVCFEVRIIWLVSTDFMCTFDTSCRIFLNARSMWYRRQKHGELLCLQMLTEAMDNKKARKLSAGELLSWCDWSSHGPGHRCCGKDHLDAYNSSIHSCTVFFHFIHMFLHYTFINQKQIQVW